MSFIIQDELYELWTFAFNCYMQVSGKHIPEHTCTKMSLFYELLTSSKC